jgi:hypothetical protein
MAAEFGYGQLQPVDTADEYSVISFIVRQLINKISTLIPVKIVSVHTQGGVAPAGTVDVQPLVALLDGAGNASQHGVVYGLPYLRLQSGTTAIILDPVPGDIGFIICADHDISAVKSTKAVAPPGSRRRFSLSDGIYFGGILNGTPQQYIQISSTGLTLADSSGNKISTGPTGITLSGTNVIIGGNLQLTGTIQGANGATYGGNITTTGTVTGGNVQAGSIDLINHKHSGVVTGGSNTGPAFG